MPHNWISGSFPSMNDLMIQNQFYQRYMWFLSLLILFFLIFSLLYLWKKAWFDLDTPIKKPKPSTIASTLKTLSAFGFLTFLTLRLHNRHFAFINSRTFEPRTSFHPRKRYPVPPLQDIHIHYLFRPGYSVP